MNSYTHTVGQSIIAMWASVVCLTSAWGADPVRINVDAQNPPFMSARDGKPSGVYPALLVAAFARIKQPLTLEVKPWKRALLELDEGKAGVAGIYKNDERAAKYDFSEPILAENTVVYFNKAKPIDFKTLADLDGKRVGVIRGWSYGNAFDAARKSGRIKTEDVPNDQSNFLKLARGRLDAVLAVEEAGKSIIAQEKLGNIGHSQIFLASNQAHLAFNKTAKQTDLLARFSKTIAEMKQDGTLDEIVRSELAKALQQRFAKQKPTEPL